MLALALALCFVLRFRLLPLPLGCIQAHCWCPFPGHASTPFVCRRLFIVFTFACCLRAQQSWLISFLNMRRMTSPPAIVICLFGLSYFCYFFVCFLLLPFLVAKEKKSVSFLSAACCCCVQTEELLLLIASWV